MANIFIVHVYMCELCVLSFDIFLTKNLAKTEFSSLARSFTVFFKDSSIVCRTVPDGWG